jgi:hypothetical protein
MKEEYRALLGMILFLAGFWWLARHVKQDAHRAFQQRKRELDDMYNEND